MQSRSRFVLMTSLEYIVGIVVSLLFSHFVGTISPSALSTISLGNAAFNVQVAVFSMLTTGSSILCARMFGEGDTPGAVHITEQTMLLGILSSTAVTALCVALAHPIMRVLLPNAEEAVFAEALSFFRVMILSFPVQLLTTILTGVLRASGNWKSPMIITFTSNAMLFVFAYLCLKVLNLGSIGAGLTYVLCRAATAVIALVILLKYNPRIRVNLKNLLKPHVPSFSRILRVGCPVAVESLFVEIGYLVANTMVLGLGTREAAIYSVANTLYSFPCVVQSITIAVATPIVGQLIGAKDYTNAKRIGWRIFRLGMEISIVLYGCIWLRCMQFGSFFTSDKDVLAGVSSMMIPMVAMIIPAVSLNTLDPQLRVGGDVKYVMIVTVFAVWLIRLPLTYFMCYRWNMGAAGVFWANTIALSVRAVLNMARFIKGKYLTMRV